MGLFMSFRHSAADRYTYLPSLGLCLLVGLGMGRLWDITARLQRGSLARAFLSVLVLSVAIGYGIKAQAQIAVWRNTETLWSHVLKYARPVPDIAYFALGKVYENKGHFDRALEFYREALSVNPTSTRFKGRIATTLAQSGDTAEARRLALQLIEDDPSNPDAYVTLGRIEGSVGRYDEAVRALEQALRLESQYPPALALLIVAHLKKNELSRARHYYEMYTEKGFSVPREIEEQLTKAPDFSGGTDVSPVHR
jgi:tetratricopeptide (TPR) repeat protein